MSSKMVGKISKFILVEENEIERKGIDNNIESI